MARRAPPWNIRDAPAEARAYYARQPLPVRAIALALDGAVRDALPGVGLGMKWAVPFYYLQGPVCYVSCAKSHVTFGLAQGAEIDDASGILAGTGKSPIRKATFRVDDDVPMRVIAGWLRQARKADAKWGTEA